ncbi:DUF542 domain-containing protein [Lutibacter flavus]|uniref:Regulator of cell morphogenesis and NO signaling n=1 Tax=Lutibacter flavus TaxID=691689 RepID=A0A238ZJ53_9FLAO|nr:DUF542 domain-containing protein [Lutibacter flavus]SNR82734.1 regulator of cell morphogenesis and NO signaling [Lutibacter flavus]
MQITKENTVADVVSKNLGSDHVFSKYKIDFCCGGGDTLDKICKESGVDFEVLKAEIESINNKISGLSNTKDADIPSIIEQAKDGYHVSISDAIFEILPFAAKVAEVHGFEHTEVVEINKLVKGVDIVITEMFQNSIMSLYPIINEIAALNAKKEGVSLELLKNLQKTIKRNEIAQQLIGDSLKEIAALSSHYSVPAEACNSYRFLYEKLHGFHHEVQKYMHLEKNVLIPKVLKEIE